MFDSSYSRLYVESFIGSFIFNLESSSKHVWFSFDNRDILSFSSLFSEISKLNWLLIDSAR